MMSGHGTIETAVEATRLGASDFIEKPLSTAKLLRGVETSLSQSTEKSRLLPSSIKSEEPVGKSPQATILLRKQAQRVCKARHADLTSWARVAPVNAVMPTILHSLRVSYAEGRIHRADSRQLPHRLTLKLSCASRKQLPLP